MFTLTFSGGRSTFLDGHPGFTEPTAKIFIKVTLPGLQRKLLAQLDTGAAYSILEVRIALDSPANQFYFGEES